MTTVQLGRFALTLTVLIGAPMQASAGARAMNKRSVVKAALGTLAVGAAALAFHQGGSYRELSQHIDQHPQHRLAMELDVARGKVEAASAHLSFRAASTVRHQVGRVSVPISRSTHYPDAKHAIDELREAGGVLAAIDRAGVAQAATVRELEGVTATLPAQNEVKELHGASVGHDTFTPQRQRLAAVAISLEAQSMRAQNAPELKALDSKRTDAGARTALGLGVALGSLGGLAGMRRR